MLNREIILQVIRQQKPLFQTKMGVKSIGLFGSYARDNSREESDVDILVEMPPDYDKMCQVWNILERELQTRIDLVRVGSHLRKSFLKDIRKEILYA